MVLCFFWPRTKKGTDLLKNFSLFFILPSVISPLPTFASDSMIKNLGKLKQVSFGLCSSANKRTDGVCVSVGTDSGWIPGLATFDFLLIR